MKSEVVFGLFGFVVVFFLFYFLFCFVFRQRKDSLQMRGRPFLHVKTRYFNGKDTYTAELCRTGKLYKNEKLYPKGIFVLQEISATLYMH